MSKRRQRNNKKLTTIPSDPNAVLLESLRREAENDISYGRPMHEESQIGIAQRIWMRGYREPAHTVLCDCEKHRQVSRFADCAVRSSVCNGTVPFVLLRYVPLICYGKHCNDKLADDEVHFLGHAKMCESCFVMCVTSIAGNTACRFMEFGPVMRMKGCRYCFPDQFKDKDYIERIASLPSELGSPRNGQSQTPVPPRTLRAVPPQ